MSVEMNQKLGGIGSILSLLGIISTSVTLFEYGVGGFSSQISTSMLGLLGVTGILGFVAFIGFVLFLVAMYGFSKDYAERRIFSYIIYGFVGAIITGLIFGVVWVAFTFVNLFNSSINPLPYSSISQYTSVLTAFFSIASLVWVYFLLKSYNLLGDKSEVPMFKIGAKILFAGVILNVVLNLVFAVLILNGSIPTNALLLASAPGGILNYVAQGVFAKSFFTIKAPSHCQTYPSIYTSLTRPQVRYCPNCGVENQTDSIYCIRCGRKL
jgi:uncharacterized membrane protein